MLVNTVDYSYFQENLQYNNHSAILKPLEQPQIEKKFTNRMHDPPFRKP